jgi:PAS domain S-box-containing protein
MIPRQEFEFLAEAIPQLVWTKSKDGSRLYLNHNWENYTGISVKDNKNWDWTDVIHPDDYTEAMNLWNESLKTGNIFEYECRLRRIDGMYRWHLSRAIPAKDKNNNISAWIGTCTDIHENKKREEELAHKNKELEKINGDMDNFIYAASHDLKSPISNIEGLVHALRDDLETIINEDENKIINMIDLSIEKLKYTIEELIEISYVHKNGHNGRELVFFENILEEVKSEIQFQIQDSGAIIASNFRCPSLSFSHKDLWNIIYNLLTNSIKFRNPRRPLKVHISTYIVDNDYTVLSIKDNGLGFDPAKKEKIFSMFRRLHAHAEGSGVGLYIVKRIIDNWGGKIEVESEEGKGAEFKVHFKNQAKELQ